MKKTIKKLIVLGIAAVMLITSLTGCTPGKDSAMLTAGESTLTFAQANFYARYNQAMNELYAQYYGTTPENMWSQMIEDGKTFEDSVKEEIKTDLERMLILEQHMEDYNITLSDEEKEKITDAAKQFIEANSEKALEVMTADQETVERVLTLMFVSDKVQAAIEDGADTNVSDEEAMRKRLRYVEFPYSMELFNAENSDDPDKTQKIEELMNSMAQADGTALKSDSEENANSAYELLKNVKDEDEFVDMAEGAGYTASITNIGEGVTTPSAKVVETGLKMKVGEVSKPVLDEEASAYYVLMLVNDFDEEATEAAKTNIVYDRKSALFEETYSAMKEAINIKWNNKRWDKISFIKQGCIYATETESDSEELTLSTDSSLTAAEGDKVNIDYAGSYMDGTAFEDGTASGTDVVLGSGTMIPGFEEGIIGHHPGETFTIYVTFPEDYDNEELAGIDVQFEMTLNGIYQ